MSQIHVFDKVLENIIATKKLKESGGFVGIPYPFEMLNKDLGAIEKDCVVGVTANSGISKSKFTRYVYIYNVYKFYKKTKYPVQIIYFPLEDSHEDVLFNMISFYLKEIHEMNVSVRQLRQLGDFELDRYTIEKIKEARGYFSDLYDIMRVVDNAFTPSGIFNVCKVWAEANGTIKYNQAGEIIGYIDRTNIHTIVILDNMSNLIPDAHHKGNKHTAIGELVAAFCRNIMAKLFKYTVVVVQQQGQAKEKVQMNQNGKHMYEKYEPALGDLAENLETQRAFHLAFGIFSPERYGLESYWNYDIKILAEFFRSIKILKSNRSASTNKIIPLWFEGASEHYLQLPASPHGDQEPSEQLMSFYNKAAMIREKQRQVQLKVF